MKQPNPGDSPRARVLDLCVEISEHNQALRDYALTPDNAWLARGELQQLGALLSDLEQLLEEIKRADSEVV